MFGFKQIKEFNIETVTQEVAAELCAIAGIWSSYKSSKYCDRFIIENAIHGPGSCNGVDLEGKHDGIRIEHKDTSHVFRIWNSGRVQCDCKLELW